MYKFYKNLIDIGLEDYLDTYFFGKEWVIEDYLEKLDKFVARKEENQKNILRKKFQSLTNHTIINDHLYELMIGVTFHPMGEFQDSSSDELSPDILDNGVSIEVKNINAEPSEIERIKKIIPDNISYGPFPSDSNFESRYRDKFSLRVTKAKRQVAGKGIIYIVWNTSLKGSTGRKPKIENLFKELIAEEKLQSPDIEIIAIDFQDLRELVVKS